MPKYNSFRPVRIDVTKKLGEMTRSIPPVIANDIRNFSMKAFRKQGWTDESFSPWKPRKKADSGRAILVKSGKLKNSIRISTANWSTIRVGSYGIPYAEIHNEGGSYIKQPRTSVIHFAKGKFSKVKKAKSAMKVQIQSHAVTMPERRFIGDSGTLRSDLKKKYISTLNRIFK